MNPLNPSFAEDVAGSFAQQPIMKLIGARLSLVEPGVVEITLPYRADLAQQHGICTPAWWRPSPIPLVVTLPLL